MQNKKIKKLLIGTNNKGKLREIRDLLPEYIKTYSTANFKLKSPKENGRTFKQNSLIKSKYFSMKTNLVCLADDSGLEIDVLNKKPGIFSARWSGANTDFSKAIKRVYRELYKKDKNWKNKKIKARFVCALSLSFFKKKLRVYWVLLREKFLISLKVKMVLVMIQFLFPIKAKKHLQK